MTPPPRIARELYRMRLWSRGFSLCMLGIAGVAQFITPGSWLTWLALVLLVVALVCSLKTGRSMRVIERLSMTGEDDEL